MTASLNRDLAKAVRLVSKDLLTAAAQHLPKAQQQAIVHALSQVVGNMNVAMQGGAGTQSLFPCQSAVRQEEDRWGHLLIV